MNLKKYLTEINLNNDPELSVLFTRALKEVFSPSYFKKINNTLVKKINIEKVDRTDGVVAYVQGNKIFVNNNVFFKQTKQAQIRYLLHEFIHILQRNKKMLIFFNFKEINKLTNELFNLLKKELNDKKMAIFLTGKIANLGPGKKNEILSYFMNDSIKWDVISPDLKKAVIQKMRESNLFNLTSLFWKKRLT
jgi:hypothetical protein